MKKSWNFRASFWLRLIILLCGLLGNALIINNNRNVGSDLVQDYIAANSLRQGGSIYGEDITKLEKELSGFVGIQNFHPPFNALLFLPFSFLPYNKAFVVLGIISLILLLMINQLVVRGLELNNEWFLNYVCFTLCWFPVLYCLTLGQSSMIIAACLIGGWFCLRLKKEYIAGFLFAIATLMKLFPGLVLLYLLILKQWRAFFATVSFLVLGLLLTAFVVGFNDMQTYSIIMVARDIDEWRGFVLNHSVTGIITRVFGDRTVWTEPLIQLPQINSLLIIFLNLSILIYTIFKIKVMAVKKELFDYGFGLTIVAMLLLSPITWEHIFPVLILPISLLLREYVKERSSRKLRIILLILFCVSLPDVLIARKLMAMHHPFIMPWYSTLLTIGPGAGLVLLWIVLTRRAKVGECLKIP